MMAVHQNQIAEAGPGNNLSYIAAVPPACQYLKLSSALAMDTHTHTKMVDELVPEGQTHN